MRHFWVLVFAAAFLPPQAVAAPDREYLAELTAKSRQLRLAERPEWRKLLHYLPRAPAWPGVRSLVDSPRFFNAPGGKTDPQTELEATLASFWSEVEETDTQQNPQCEFIARRAWLDEQLGFDPARLPRRECRRYAQWHASINPKGLTLIFASAYVNNPASMYGHTLLRVDAKDQNERTRLLAYTLNFAAATDETNGLLFAVNGLLGGYRGMFSILPYYMKVREYSDLENRDIWEYELDFTPREVDLVLMHAWEMGPSWFQYFFFDENCSYQLLALLQVARPELDLVAPFRWWALPSDTVRAVTGSAGLLSRAVFRPSQATVVGRRLEGLSEPERDLVKQLSMARIGAGDARLRVLPEDRAAATIEAGYDYVNYRRAIGKQDVPDPAALARELLVARSSLDAGSQAPAIATPGVRPDQGHSTSRVDLGAGRRAGRNFQELRARASYHDLVDPEEGYERGAQLEYFGLRLRRYEQGPVRIEDLAIIDIFSLSRRDEFFQPRSWKFTVGLRREFLADGSDPLALALDGGAGGAWSAAGGRSLVYAMADGAARQHHRLDGGYALGAGARAGALLDAGSRWGVHAYARALRYVLGDLDTPRSLGLESRLTLGRDLALRLDISRNREHGRLFNAAAVSILWYL